MAATETTTPASNGVTSLAGWSDRAVHTITLPSGARVKVRFPDLSRLVKDDFLPETLRGVALQQALGELNLTPDDSGRVEQQEERYEVVKKLAELIDFLVADMVVEPHLTVEDLKDIPAEDRDMLASIAQRERDTDALGVTLGVEPLRRWEKFRLHHGCDQDCPSCKAVRDDFSTVDLGGV